MYSLIVAFRSELKERMWQDYTATILWGIGKTIGRDSWVMPEYMELAHPSVIKDDMRSPSEIIDHIRKEL